MKDFIKINENDNVIVALKELTAGETILAGTQEVTARETIPAGHKMAIRDIAVGAEVIKYGFRIGNAKENIAAGQWVHVHNLKTALGDLLEYTYEPVETNVKKTEDVKFMGFALRQWKSWRPQRSLDHPDRRLCQQYCNRNGEGSQHKSEGKR